MISENNNLVINQLLIDYSSTLNDWKILKDQLDNFEPDPEDYEEIYCECLDEIYEIIKIGYGTFTASEILKNCDPIMFNTGLYEFVDAEFHHDKSTSVEYVDLEDQLTDLESELEKYQEKLKELKYDIDKLEIVPR